ncbi:hypothetical protein N7493_006705 [Penicillium malachiteum]|uniref:Ig-like domain-containing protein n=1 Tax=Penicillium malachiteum TaxID=1324776 RepID=A0AAD6HJ58_9EURO|nr:hypothetical protein N7493_006705 [Penicillium malachiteum]
MRFHTVALLTGASAVAAGNTANLLLPGFEGHDLQAGVLGKDADATTYLVTCPSTVASTACGIPGSGMTAIAAPTSAQLIHVNDGNTASLSCNVAGTTYASCYATYGTATAHQTLTGTNLNWMAVTVTTSSTPTPTPTSIFTTSTSTLTSTTTSTHTTVTPTSTFAPSSTSTPVWTPKKSPKSSSRVATSTPLVTSAPTAPGSGNSAPAATQSAAVTTPATAGAGTLARNGWVLGGAMALAYAFA